MLWNAQNSPIHCPGRCRVVPRSYNNATLHPLSSAWGVSFLRSVPGMEAPAWGWVVRLAQNREMQKLSARVSKLLHNSKQAQKLLTSSFLRKSKLKLQWDTTTHLLEPHLLARSALKKTGKTKSWWQWTVPRLHTARGRGMGRPFWKRFWKFPIK